MYIELISVCNAKVMNAMDWFYSRTLYQIHWKHIHESN